MPNQIQLAPADTQTFRAWGITTAGDSVAVSASFAATGGTITSGGLFQAGQTAGDFQVTATAPNGGPSSNSAVAIRTAPPGRGLANECANRAAAWIWCDDFDQDRLASYFEYTARNGSFVRVGGAGLEASTGMRGRFTAGQVDAGALHLAFGKTPDPYFRPVDAGTALYREIYWRFYLWNAPGWTGGGGFKLTRATSFASAGWAQAMIGHLWSGGSAPRDDYLVLDPASGTDPAGALVTTSYNDFANLRWLGASLGTTPLFAPGSVGVWRCIEVRIRLNDPGLSNGIFAFWINGQLEASRADLNWVGNFASFGINAVFLENYWNGGAPVAEDRIIDNFVVSTAPIGCR